MFSRGLKNNLLVGQVWLFSCTMNTIKSSSELIYAVITLELLIFFLYKLHLIISAYSHHPEMFIILLQPLHPFVIQFDYIWCNRFGAHKIICISSHLCNCPEWLHFMAWCWAAVAPLRTHWICCSLATSGLRRDLPNALCQSCKNYTYHWCVPFLCFNELILQDYYGI